MNKNNIQNIPPHRLTADKRLRYASPKLPSATSFIRDTLSELMAEGEPLVKNWIKATRKMEGDSNGN
jgi:hypothetical protein